MPLDIYQSRWACVKTGRHEVQGYILHYNPVEHAGSTNDTLPRKVRAISNNHLTDDGGARGVDIIHQRDCCARTRSRTWNGKIRSRARELFHAIRHGI